MGKWRIYKECIISIRRRWGKEWHGIGKLETYRKYTSQYREIKQIRYIFIGICTAVFMSYLFYESSIAVLFFTPYVFIYAKKKKEQEIKKENWELNLQFKEVLNSIAGALHAGYSLESCFEEALIDMRNLYSESSRINQELQKIVYGLKMNQTIETVLEEFAQRSGVDDIEAFAEVVSISKRSGGDMIKVISHTAKTISDRIEVKRQVVTLTAGKRFEVKIMSQVPIGIILYMKLFSGDIMRVMYHNVIGISIMSVLLILYMFAYLLSIRIVEIEL